MDALKSPFLLDILRARAETSGSALAFVDLRSGRQITYEALHALALALAARLRARGIEKGSVVALVANDPTVFALLAACGVLGAQLAVIDSSLHPLEIQGLIEHADPKLVLANADLAERLSTPNRTLVELAAFVAQPDPGTSAEKTTNGQGKLIIYTSGSSGSPKGVVLTESALAANGGSLAAAYHLTPGDRLLCVLPFYHMNALMVTGWGPLRGGATVVVAPLFSAATAKSYWATVAEHGITVASLTPSIMSALLKLDEGSARRERPAALRMVFCGAAPLRPDLWQRFEEYIGVPVHQGYGLTETTCWASMTLPEHTDRAQVYETVGVPVDCEIRITSTSRSADDLVFARRVASESVEPQAESEGSEEAAASRDEPHDEPDDRPIGEVEIRGPILMEGYYRNKVLTRETFTPDGFLRTGDLGFYDEHGLLRIIGRSKEIIIKNGINIVPEEVDGVLRRFPGVAEAKSIGLPDDVLGELICSVCVMQPGVTPPRAPEIRRFVSQHLASFKTPDRIVFAGHIPRTPTGKPRVGELRRILNGDLATELLGRLDTWKFKRAHPSEREQILERVQTGLLTGGGTTFVQYWGCGNREAIADPDREALERLKEYTTLADRPPYAVSRVVLIFTDVHAMINGKQRWESYFAQIREYARKLDFETVWLSDLWQQSGFDQQAFLAGKLTPPENGRGSFAEFQAQLVQRAEKHSEIYSAEEAARIYYDACQFDAVAVENAFKDAVFLTYNGPESHFTLPRLPTMYVYSYKRKRTEKPWFM